MLCLSCIRACTGHALQLQSVPVAAALHPLHSVHCKRRIRDCASLELYAYTQTASEGVGRASTVLVPLHEAHKCNEVHTLALYLPAEKQTVILVCAYAALDEGNKKVENFTMNFTI